MHSRIVISLLECLISTDIHSQLVIITSSAHPQSLFTAIFVHFYGSQLSLRHKSIQFRVLLHYCSLWSELEGSGAKKNRRYDLILFCAMCFPSAVRPSLKVALEPTPVCRWATHGTPTVTRHLPLELHELKQDHIHGLIHREFECDCVGTCRRFGSGMPRCSDLLSPTNFHLPRLVAFCQHFFINAVHRNWELDQEAQRDLSLH